MNDQPAANTDRELYREPAGDLPSDYYAPSVHVTADGRIGMNVGGTVMVMPIREWFERATLPPDSGVDAPTEPGQVAFEIEVVPHDWPNDGMGWHKGRDTPERVAATLRHYADQVESFTPPNPPKERPLTDAEVAAIIAKKMGRESDAECTCGHYYENHPCAAGCGCER